jgi:hypothetical protein
MAVNAQTLAGTNQFRLEWQGQKENEAEQHQHCALTLGDSLS